MWLFYVSIIMAVVANIFYYIIQKSTPGDVNPVLSLCVTYFTAMITCLVVLPFYPSQEGLLASFKRLNWTSISLGVAIVVLELGFLLAFRAGWNLSVAGVFVNALVAVILIPVGILLFRESITFTNAVGIVLCLAGLVLIAKK